MEKPHKELERRMESRHLLMISLGGVMEQVSFLVQDTQSTKQDQSAQFLPMY